MKTNDMLRRLTSKKRILCAKVARYKMTARQIGVEYGWLWLYRNGFRRRVPEEAQRKIAEYDEAKE